MDAAALESVLISDADSVSNLQQRDGPSITYSHPPGIRSKRGLSGGVVLVLSFRMLFLFPSQ